MQARLSAKALHHKRGVKIVGREASAQQCSLQSPHPGGGTTPFSSPPSRPCVIKKNRREKCGSPRLGSSEHSRWQHDVDLKPSSNSRSRLSCREWNGAGLPIAPAHVVLIRCTSNIVARFDQRAAHAAGGGVRGSRRPRHLYISVVRGGVLLAAACRARFRGAPQAPHPHQPVDRARTR